MRNKQKKTGKIFKFTRHVLSCNNINMGDGFITNHDYEPGLSHSGILETLKYVKEHKDDFKSCDVCVSNLYRTWCTAVILYGNGLDKKPQEPGMIHYLNLWICPHLKEHYPYGPLFKHGNAPRPMNIMAEKFKTFLNTLMIIIDKDKYEDFHFPNRIYLNLSSTSNKTNNENSTSNKTSYIIYEKNRNENTYTYDFKTFKNNEYYIDKTRLNEKWLETGNLSTFMDWFEQNFTENEKFNTEKVHVVTHSNVLQNYLKDIKLFKLKKKYDHEGRFCFTKKSHKSYYTKVTEKNIDFIGKTNCWSFETKSSFLDEIQAFFNENNSLSNKILDILSNKISIHDMIIELNQYYYVEPINNLISILSSIKMGVIERPDANKIESQNESLSLCGKYKQKTKKGGKLKRKKITRKRRNTRTRKKSFVKRGGCYRPENSQVLYELYDIDLNKYDNEIQLFKNEIDKIYPPSNEFKNEIDKIYPPWNKFKIEELITKIINHFQIKDISELSKYYNDSNQDNRNNQKTDIEEHIKRIQDSWKQLNAIKHQVIYFVKTYPDKTITEYGVFNQDYPNLCRDKDNILILDKDGRPIFCRHRELLDEGHIHLWNILHKDDGLSTYGIIDFKSMDENIYTSSYNEIKDKLIEKSCNNQLKQDIETYIETSLDKTYEDWIKQDNIFQKYKIGEDNIFSIMYLNDHPALHYWNEYSKTNNQYKNLVEHRTKQNQDGMKPNDPNIYVYKIENKKP